MVFCKKVFLKISQNSQENENICARVSFLIKLQVRPATLLKKRLWHRCFAVNFPKFLRHLWATASDHYDGFHMLLLLLMDISKSLLR